MKDLESYLSDTLRKGEESGARYVRFEIELLRYLVKHLESDRELIKSLREHLQIVNTSRITRSNQITHPSPPRGLYV